VRRVRGTIADEVFLLSRPADADLGSGAERQAQSAYAALLSRLTAQGVEPIHVVSETVHARSVGDTGVIASARAKAFAGARLDHGGPAAVLLGQPPSRGAALEVSAVALVPRPDVTASRAEIRCTVSCSCPSCKGGARARLERIGDESRLYSGVVYGSGSDGASEAYDMFVQAGRLLEQAEMSFRDVIRTWIYVRDIDRDYAALNQARRAFFRDSGLERKPASTGVQGIPAAERHNFSMSFYAVKSARPLGISVMSCATLNEAWTYGADFSRGLRVTDANKTSLLISGTASIGEAGQTVATGDFGAQAQRMLVNIESLLAAQGASVDDVVSAVTYLKHVQDGPLLQRAFDARGFHGFPCAVVEAPLCRPELLCETEAVAVLPGARS